MLDLLNGIARSHGELSLGVGTAAPLQTQAFFGGRRFMVRFGIFGGGGLGFAIP